jgi:hypothetical protein
MCVVRFHFKYIISNLLTVTPAFFGAGMLSGMNASWSFFGGFVLAWGIIAPSLIATGGAVGRQRSPDEFPEVWSYQAMSFKTLEDYIHSPSPRYWLLWPGVLIMLIYSFAEMFMSSRAAFKSFGKLGPAIVNSIRRFRVRGDPNTIHHEDDNDPTRVSNQRHTCMCTRELRLMLPHLTARRPCTSVGLGQWSRSQFDHVLRPLGHPVLAQRGRSHSGAW